MINSKLSKKSFKKRSLKLKNKRTNKSKVSKKNVRNMRGGTIDDEIKESFKHFILRNFQPEIMKIATGKFDYIPILDFFDNICIRFYSSLNTAGNYELYDYLTHMKPENKQNLLKPVFDEIINIKIKLINEKKASKASQKLTASAASAEQLI